MDITGSKRLPLSSRDSELAASIELMVYSLKCWSSSKLVFEMHCQYTTDLLLPESPHLPKLVGIIDIFPTMF